MSIPNSGENSAMVESDTPPWQLDIKEVEVSELREMPDNVREHDRRSIEAIKESYETSRQQKPIVVANDGTTVIAGNGQLLAVRELGWDRITVSVSPFEPGSKEAELFAIQDNRSGELSSFNTDRLKTKLKNLSSDLRSRAGFDPSELENILGGDKNKIINEKKESDDSGDDDEDSEYDDPNENVSGSDPNDIGAVQYRVIVDVPDETEQGSLIERLESEGYVCRPLMS